MITTQWIVATSRRLGLVISLLSLGACGGGTTSGGSATGAGATAVLVTANMSVTWNTPTTTVDQSCAQNLAGYRLYVGNQPGVYSVSIPIAVGDASCTATGTSNSCGAVLACTYTVQGLTGWTGTSWHFAVTAYDDDGNESAYSSETSYAIN